MPDFLFDLPLALIGLAIIVALCLYSVTGLLLVRRFILPRLRVQIADSEFGGAMLQAVMVFYGLASALIAVGVWQTYSDTAKLVSGEATSLAALYRDASTYPEPTRSNLQADIREYTRYVIEEAWPLQRKGEVPVGGVARIDTLQGHLIAFQPETESQKILRAEAFRAYNTMVLARRLRLDSVTTGLPAVMWFVVIAGALIGLTSSFFFKVDDARFQSIHAVLLSTFIGLVIFLIVALDRPYRGDLGLSAEPYQLVYDQLMTPRE
ncbi:MAG: DUF4239 domain-containing protein [Phycisphaeraceae bacterium]|nr:MAG: DUF4239 domain-containing protein [Phycisphaeraceae bacterium]